MRKFMIGLVVAFSVACFGDEITGSSTVTGTYTLSTINGSPLPYTVSQSGTTKTEIIDHVIRLYEGTTYSELSHSRTTVNGQAVTQSVARTGNWSIPGANSLWLRTNETGGAITVTIITGNKMTIAEVGMTKVFIK